MKKGILGSLALVALFAATAAAQSPTADVQGATKASPAQAQPTTQPAAPSVVPPQQGRQVFKANTGAGPSKPAIATPTPTVTLKPGEIPKIQFDTPIYDFGRVKAGGDVEHDYWFTNSGNGTLEILAVKPG